MTARRAHWDAEEVQAWLKSRPRGLNNRLAEANTDALEREGWV